MERGFNWTHAQLIFPDTNLGSADRQEGTWTPCPMSSTFSKRCSSNPPLRSFLPSQNVSFKVNISLLHQCSLAGFCNHYSPGLFHLLEMFRYTLADIKDANIKLLGQTYSPADLAILAVNPGLNPSLVWGPTDRCGMVKLSSVSKI